LAGALPSARADDGKPAERFQLPSHLHSITNDEAAQLGRDRAKKDFAAQRYYILEYGMPSGSTEAEKNLEKVGIRFESIAGCLVSQGIRGFSHGYNSTMQPLLKKQFGADVFKGTKIDRQ
jgi:hypothetical protein